MSRQACFARIRHCSMGGCSSGEGSVSSWILNSKPRIPTQGFPENEMSPCSFSVHCGPAGPDQRLHPLPQSQNICRYELECVVTSTVFIHDIIPLSQAAAAFCFPAAKLTSTSYSTSFPRSSSILMPSASRSLGLVSMRHSVPMRCFRRSLPVIARGIPA